MLIRLFIIIVFFFLFLFFGVQNYQQEVSVHFLHYETQNLSLSFVIYCAFAAGILFMFLLLRSVRIAARSADPFPSLVAFGLASAWFVHIVVNVGMTLNLMPVTGIPLPFFSYGGSFMLMCWLSVGILVRISGEGRGVADMLVI